MTKILSTSIVFALFLTACATKQPKQEEQKPAEPAAATQTETHAGHNAATQCTKGKDERALHISKKQPAGCELHYTKFGKTTTSASSSISVGHCENVKARIEKNLKSAGFECR